MADIVKALVVVLEEGTRDDEAERIRLAILQMRGVLGIETQVEDMGDYIVRFQLKQELKKQLRDMLT